MLKEHFININITRLHSSATLTIRVNDLRDLSNLTDSMTNVKSAGIKEKQIRSTESITLHHSHHHPAFQNSLSPGHSTVTQHSSNGSGNPTQRHQPWPMVGTSKVPMQAEQPVPPETHGNYMLRSHTAVGHPSLPPKPNPHPQTSKAVPL